MEINQPGIKIFGTFIPTPIQPPHPEPAIPNLQEILQSLGVPETHNPTHFFSKTLFQSDTQKGLTRLTIPRNRILTTFLTNQEEQDLQRGERLDVKVIDPSLEVRDLSLSRWNYKKATPKPNSRNKAAKTAPPSYSYALNGGWMEIVDGNGLAPGKTIEVWSFRFGVKSSLGFIIFEVNNVDDKAVLDGASSSSDGSKEKNKASTVSWGMKKRRGSNSSLSTMSTV